MNKITDPPPTAAAASTEAEIPAATQSSIWPRVMSLLLLFWRDRRFHFRFFAYGALGTIILALAVPKRYETTTRIMPPDLRGGMPSSLAAVASAPTGGGGLNGFTNQGNIMGSWLGRAAQGEQVWITYWRSARNKIQFNYRHRQADAKFIAGGGSVNSAAVRADIWVGARAQVIGLLQYETWNFPVLAPRMQRNVTASLQFTFWPQLGK